MCSLGIDVIVAAGEHRDGAGREARAMRGRIDAAREARSDHETGFAELAREALGEFQSGRRRIARADHRDHRPRQRGEIAAHREQRRRVVDLGEPLRIGVFASATKRNAELPAASISRSASARGSDADGARGAAAAGKFGQRFDRRARIAVLTQQPSEGARPDIVAADQPQPVEPLFVGECHATFTARAGRFALLADLAFGAWRMRRDDVGAVLDDR